MCGISGLYLRKREVKASDINELESSLESIKHRGPDASAIVQKGNKVLLGHNRLSIIDLTEGANQPFVIGEFTLIFNGEIYNYKELRSDLERQGKTFRTNSDTEVLLVAFIQWGHNFTEKLRGMWSFAIFNNETKEMFLSRDRFGIKPLYYFTNDSGFYFASEIKALFTFGAPRRIDRQILINYYVSGLTDYDERTFFIEIKQVTPGRNLIVRDGEITEIKKYYEINSVDTEFTEPDLLNAFDLHLRSDVKIGTSLSGGVDSSLIAAYTAKVLKQDNFIAICSEPRPKDKSELIYAKEVSDYSKIDLRVSDPDETQFFADIEKFVYAIEEPTISSSPYLQYKVMEKAKSLNIKVMLDGQGGDEAFLGYERYYICYLLNLAMDLKIYEFIKSAFEITKNSKLSLLDLAKYFVYFGIPGVRSFVALIRNSELKFKDKISYCKDMKFESFLNLKKLRFQEYFSTQLPHLLRYEDRNSMAHSIEARVPFVDHRVIEGGSAQKVSNSFRNGYTKFFLRQILSKYSTPNIAWRRKKYGFESPEKSWMLNNREKVYAEILNSEINKSFIDNKKISSLSENKLWRLYNIAIFEKVFKVSF